MKKYVICVDNGADYNAATKARQDAETIMRSMGCEPLLFPGERTAAGNLLKQVSLFFRTLTAWQKLNRTVEPGSLVIMQYPFFPIKMVYVLRQLLPRTQKKKKARFLALIHDLNSLRGFYGNAAVFSDTRFLKLFDHIITHNRKMTEYLVEAGIPEDKLTELELFDYLTDAVPKEHTLPEGIAVAGNLDPEKSGYISRLVRMADENLPLHLYGRGLKGKNEVRSLSFHGAFAPEILPGELEGAFGLVWDGSSAETCEGLTGNYLRYNNPHKLSLYLASGLPVIIWKEAAEAGFIKDNNLGLLISNLTKIPDLIRNTTEDTYREMQAQAQKIQARVRDGSYLAEALRKAEKSI